MAPLALVTLTVLSFGKVTSHLPAIELPLYVLNENIDLLTAIESIVIVSDIWGYALSPKQIMYKLYLLLSILLFKDFVYSVYSPADVFVSKNKISYLPKLSSYIICFQEVQIFKSAL